MLSLAYFSPLPPARTGIADYSRELLPFLARRARVTLFTDAPPTDDVRSLAQYPLADYGFRRWGYDAALFQMGNSEHHAPMVRVFRRYPGILVLHDAVLHHFLADQTAGRGNFPAYARELGYEMGNAGIHLARDIQYQRQPHPLFAMPLTRRLLDLSLGVLVHSRYAAARVRAHTNHPVGIIPALIDMPSDHSRRHQLDLPPDTLLCGSFGQITAARQMDVVLAAFARLRQTHPHAHYLIVGDVHPEVDLPGLIAAHDLAAHVTHLGYVPNLAAFVDWIGSVDVVINLRYPTAGETSATALRALAAARPLIVSDDGWYAELPDTIVLKMPPRRDPDALLPLLRHLADHPDRQRAMGEAARAYVAVHHQGGAVADAYVAFVARVLRQLHEAAHA